MTGSASANKHAMQTPCALIPEKHSGAILELIIGPLIHDLAFATRGFAFPNCDLNSPWHGVYTNTCNTPSFAMFSTQIYWLNSGRREEFKFPTNTTNCEKVEPDGFGFVDEDGVEHQGVISLEKKEAIIEAVHKGDYVALKALL
ncbi:hypothetical protein DFP72DRAFT_851460 [Ephemerocybe angulata]|uniref:Uncharacterized protein n=1 Tax=Ephemerocybe angulata TaxID=980116 RepID=A0A8H6HQ34_9AGAR|nr:hypothetical protein DFP72DRAFT_851460 [Tulosesus angulatus]